MLQDIVNGSFKGFAMLRQMVLHAAQAGEAGLEAAGPLPVYIEGCAPHSGTCMQAYCDCRLSELRMLRGHIRVSTVCTLSCNCRYGFVPPTQVRVTPQSALPLLSLQCARIHGVT